MPYDSDLTDDQWDLIADLLPAAKPGGRPRTTSLRRVLDGIFYVLKTGCPWRYLPSNFPNWRTVYGYYANWLEDGVFWRIHQFLYPRVRRKEGRDPQPTVVIVDSQTVSTGKMGGERGYDGGKRRKGRKRHLAVDTLGLLVGARVSAANVHDTHGGMDALERADDFLGRPEIELVYADKGYQGERFETFVRETFDARVRIGDNKTNPVSGFVPDKQRWVVERTFAWLYDYRRLLVDHERLLRRSLTMIRLAAIRLILRRLCPQPPVWTS
jgi:putative transposase